ncbi:hypothetical protein CEB3_c19970 [Peptococcaceae bacterium CEB3]|nr:hypothetical protein CEB3_c19970 [Peptococcaceae bacterium CEB3]
MTCSHTGAPVLKYRIFFKHLYLSTLWGADIRGYNVNKSGGTMGCVERPSQRPTRGDSPTG